MKKVFSWIYIGLLIFGFISLILYDFVSYGVLSIGAFIGSVFGVLAFLTPVTPATVILALFMIWILSKAIKTIKDKE